MDYNVLKKRPSFPFENIAVAVSFSPRLEGLLREAHRIAAMFNSSLIIIHIGKKNPEHEERLEKYILKTGISKLKYRLIWMEGEPVDTILKLSKLNVVDLLILGALEKENLYKYYVGSIARTISRRAKCSVLLLTNPSINPPKIKNVVVSGTDNPKTIHTIKTMAYWARHEKINSFAVVQEVNIPALTISVSDAGSEPEVNKIKREMFEEENQRLINLIKTVDNTDVEIRLETVNGKPGFAISNYAKNKKADLLVFNSPDTHLGLFDRIFTHDIEFVLADLPCNLLIVHSRV
jgi:nucleotide-binding universal stress UspA family protein